MASETIDGITYVTRGDVTFARSTPTMPAHVYTTPAAKKRRAIFNMIRFSKKRRCRVTVQNLLFIGVSRESTSLKC